MTEQRRYLYSLEEIKTRLQQRAHELARTIAPDGHLAGGEWMARNPSRVDRKPGSFCINIRKGVWKDFATDQGGDMLALIAEFACGGNYSRAVLWAKDFLGLTGRAPDPAEARQIEAEAVKAREEELKKAEGRRRAAFKLFCDAKPLDGTDPASLYLKARGIDVTQLAGGIPRALRFHPAVMAFPENTTHPAMVACISREGLPHGFAAVHRTYLTCADVWKKHSFPPMGGKRMASKRILGSVAGGTIRLAAGKSGKKLGDAPAGEWLAVTEGIENALTIAIARPELRVLACASLSYLGSMALPEKIGGVYVVADNDAPGSDAAKAFERAIERLRENHAVAVVRLDAAFKDANDVLLGKRKEGAA